MHRSLQFDLLYLLFSSPHQHQVFHNGPHNLSLSPPLSLLYTGSYCTTHEMEGCIVPFSLTFCTCCSPPLTSVRYSTMATLASWLSCMAASSHTQQCIPRRPLYTQRRCLKPKSSNVCVCCMFVHECVCVYVMFVCVRLYDKVSV